MSYTDFNFGERLIDLRVADEQRQGALRRLQSQARQGRRGWVFEKRCWILCQLGNLFVSLGVRLLRAGLPPSLPAAEQTPVE
jgi:hypothetical protein